MAKAHTVDDVVQSIIDNYQPLLKDAVVHVAEQAKKDIKDKAVKVLYEYYYGGYKQTSYDRIYALQHAIIPFAKISTVGSKIKLNVGVEYSPDALKNYLDTLNGNPYKASKKYDRANADWVVQNFWEGKHPYTDGSNDPGAKIDYHMSTTTQDYGMMITNDETGPGLYYYRDITIPHAVMDYMIIHGSKLF